MKTTFEFNGVKVEMPLSILNALQAADFSDEQIYLMTPRERFIAFCEWEGLIGSWGSILWDLVKES